MRVFSDNSEYISVFYGLEGLGGNALRALSQNGGVTQLIHAPILDVDIGSDALQFDFSVSISQQGGALSTTIPGDVSTTATVAVGAQVSDALEVIGDQDWFSITLVAGQTYDISLMGSGGSPLSDPLVRILDSVGSELVTNDDIVLGAVRHSLITYTATTTATYYISAQAFSTQVGTYTLSVTETASADIAGDDTTTAVAVVDGSVSGTLETISDTDWFEITLDAGSRYKIANTGTGANGLTDAFVSLYDASGTLVASNDDSGPSNNALLAFNVTATGTYYIAASSFTGSSGSDGDYAISVQEVPLLAERTIDGVANFLTDEFGSRASYASTSITYNVTGLDAGAALLAVRALTAWSDVSALTFTAVTTGGDIVFTDTIDELDENDPNDTGANANNSNTTSGSTIISSALNVSSNWNGENVDVDGYTYQTFLHEIGHALGLGHAGPYNGNATYDIDNAYLNDSWAYTVMSYFDQNESGYFGDYRFVLGPQIADIVAIQDLYGANTTTRSGDTVYGFNSTEAATVGSVTGSVHNFANFTRAPSLSIYDMGGNDTLDLSGYSQDQRIDLNAEAFSDVNGIDGVISIARGVIIENAIGGTGVDTITGNAEDNELTGGEGDDILDGGEGTDYAVYSGSSVADYTIVENVNGSFTVTHNSSGSDGSDTLTNIEFLRINGVDTVLEVGFAGFTEDADTYEGTDGNDVFHALGGNDIVSGGLGNDSIYGDAGADILSGGDGVDRLYGGADNDTLYGENDVDILKGEDGNDTLYGGAGNDVLYGADGADVMYGDADNDKLFGGNGADRLYGGAGDDAFKGEAGADKLFGGDGDDSLNGGADNDSLYGDAGVDKLYGGDGVDRLYGGTGNDTLFGQNDVDVLKGEDGNDTLYGGSGNDVLYGNDGADVIYGDADNDKLFGGNGADKLYGGAGDDSFKGDAGADKLYGGDGADSLNGGADNDSLYGDAGIDKLYGGDGVDRLYGGTGDDFLYGQNDLDVLKGEDGNDTLYGGNGNDVLYGGEGADILYGDADNDKLFGGNGADKLYGGAGDDAFKGEAGADKLFGGDGDDSLNGGADNDSLYGDAGIDKLYGGDGIDKLFGGDGNDFLYGQNDLDVLKGEAGNDVLYGGAGNDVLYGGIGNDVLYGDADNDKLFGGDGNDNLYGGAGNDAFKGEAGADKLFGGDGADSLNGGDGNDSIYGDAGIDKLYGGDGVDRLYGGTENDVLYGQNDVDVLKGEDGDDTLFGGNGNDVLYGGEGADTLYGDADNDKLFGGNGNDTMYGGAGDDAFKGEAGADELHGGDGADSLNGGADNDMIYGDAGIDKLYGGDGNDTLFGGAGDDFLYGQGGADIFVIEAGAGTDSIYGFDDGSDLIDMSAGASDISDLALTQVGGNVEIVSTMGTTILVNMLLADVGADDFIFTLTAEEVSVQKGALVSESLEGDFDEVTASLLSQIEEYAPIVYTNDDGVLAIITVEEDGYFDML